MKINGIEVIGKNFAYDGCHKIYILEDKQDIEDALDSGYTEIFPISKIKEIYFISCPLRFISNWKLTKYYVEQCEDAQFE